MQFKLTCGEALTGKWLLIIMRSFIFLFSIGLFAFTPSNALSQNSKVIIQDDVTLTVDEVFELIMKQTDYKFFYEKGIFNDFPKVELKKGGISTDDLLKKSLPKGNFKITITEDNVILIKKEPSQKGETKPQDYYVEGLVTDESGQPLPGANIVEKGTNNGTQSDFDGNFKLTLGGANSTVLVSYIGFKSKEINVNGQSRITVVLQEDAEGLDEVVVVGYGAQKKVTVTGSVADIKSEEIQQTRTANLANNLAGRVAGLVINSRGGEPGADNVDILIRGIATTGDTSPLFVIDGIANRGSFERLNPEDIESISVLKDASAGIYGAQAANGVILITTKRGKEGKTRFNFNHDYSLSQPTRRPYLMNAQQYLTWVDEQNTRNGRPPEFQDIIEQYENGTNDPTIWGDTDWWDVVMDDWTPQVQHSVSVSGGNEKTKFYLSGQFLDQDALYKGDAFGYKQYNARSNIDTKITKNLGIGFDVAARIGDRVSSNAGTEGLIRQVFVQAPFDSPFFSNGLVAKTTRGNPINQVNGDSGNRTTRTKRFDSKFSFNYQMPFIADGLYASGYAAIDFYTTDRKDISTPFDLYRFDEATNDFINLREETGRINLFEQHMEELNKTFHVRLGYDKNFGKHSISSFIAYEQYTNDEETFFASRQDLVTAEIPFLFSGVDENQQNGGFGFQSARRNYFGRLNYNYDEKYLAEVTFRYDGSANFAKDRRYGFFPGVSLGWRISKEPFFKSNLISELKLRGSWGKLGNDRLLDVNGAPLNFQFLQNYNIENSAIFGENTFRTIGLTPAELANPNITWETSEKINLGMDFRLRKGLLDGNIDLFQDKRSDILAPRNASVPVYSGIILPHENIGEVTNRGLELQLNHRNNLKELNYTIGGQFTYAKSEINFIDEPANIPEWQRRTGKPVDFILVYEADGLYQDQAEIDDSPHFPDAKPGDVKFVDQNNDGIIDTDDQIILRNSPTPKITYGLSIGLEWKGLALNAFFQGQAEAQTIYRPWDLNQQSVFFTERWISKRETPNAIYPAAFDVGSSSFQNVSTIWAKDNSFLRAKNIELSYTFEKSLLEKLGVKNLRLFVSGHNLFFIYDNVGINDPESTSSTGWFYPQQRLISTGINLAF